MRVIQGRRAVATRTRTARNTNHEVLDATRSRFHTAQRDLCDSGLRKSTPWNDGRHECSSKALPKPRSKPLARASSPCMAARGRRCCSCTAIRSAICRGRNSRRGWRKISPWWRRICAATAIPKSRRAANNHVNYSFRAMAQDQIEVMAALGHKRFYAAGHDRGARVLHRMCLDHPDNGGARRDPRHHAAASRA